MKFYCLKHPTLGYLRSKSSYSNNWTFDLEKAKKWSKANHPSGVRTQSYSEELKECEVWPVEYFIHSEGAPQVYGGRKITKDFRY